jgi:hypothetical protein
MSYDGFLFARKNHAHAGVDGSASDSEHHSELSDK